MWSKVYMKITDPLDIMNLKDKGTQHTKSVKLKETTYNMLLKLKKENKYDMKSIDDVIVAALLVLTLRSM